MAIYPRFLIKEGDRFVPFEFPKLEASMEQVVSQLSPLEGPKGEMLLSFTRHHSIHSELVTTHPHLAALISSGSMPLQVLEDLFESSKRNTEFQNGLQDYVLSLFPNEG